MKFVAIRMCAHKTERNRLVYYDNNSTQVLRFPSNKITIVSLSFSPFLYKCIRITTCIHYIPTHAELISVYIYSIVWVQCNGHACIATESFLWNIYDKYLLYIPTVVFFFSARDIQFDHHYIACLALDRHTQTEWLKSRWTVLPQYRRPRRRRRRRQRRSYNIVIYEKKIFFTQYLHIYIYIHVT